MSGDFYKEWRNLAEVDYFPQFILLWLSANAWYRSHYSEITTRKDRDFLDKLREDHSSRNKMFSRFNKFIQAPDTKEHGELLSRIEGLFFALNRAELFWDDGECKQKITIGNCLLHTNPRQYGSLRVNQRSEGIIISETVKLTADKSCLFNGLLEIIYKVRCLLVHGDLEPNSENQEVVKQCYFMLHTLMGF